MVKNYMEILVQEILDEVIDDYNICKCDECIDDIKSIALNNLTCAYFDSSVDDSKRKAFLLDRQNRIAVLAKVIDAMNIVSKRKY